MSKDFSSQTEGQEYPLLKNNPWTPDYNFLRLAYEKNNSYYHGIAHILRVWTIAMVLAEPHLYSIDLDVLSAAAFFHDIGRTHDLRDDDHGNKSAVWIEEILPVATDTFSKDQIEMIKTLSRLHCLDDNHYSTLELKILKDADAIDRFRLPKGKIDKKYLRLKESIKLVEVGERFNKIWSSNRKTSKDPFVIWAKSVQELNIIPQHIIEVINKSGVKDESRNKTLFHNTESNLKKVEDSAINVLKGVKSGKLSDKSLQHVENLLDIIQQTTKKDSYFSELSQYIAGRIITKSYKQLLVDHSIPTQQRNHIRSTYKECVRLINNKNRLIDSKVLYNFLSYIKKHSSKCLRDGFIDYLAFNSENDYVDIFIFFEKGSLKKRQYQPQHRIQDQAYSKLLLNISSDEYSDTPWLWIRTIEKWINESKTDLRNGLPQISKQTLGYTMQFIIHLLNSTQHTTKQINSLLRAYLKIEKLNLKYDLGLETEQIVSLWQSNQLSIPAAAIYKRSGVSPYLNVFYLYDGYTRDITQHIKLVEHLCIYYSKKGVDTDNLVSKYLLPISLSPEFSYKINTNIIKLISSPRILERINSMVSIMSNRESTSQSENILDFYKERSSKNLQQLVDKSKYNGKVTAKNRYEVVSNITDIKLLHKIATNKGTLLSSLWNILQIPKKGAISLTFKGSYLHRTKHRDMVQRDMLIRRPNIAKDHPYYGTLQNINDLLTKDNIFSQIPSPTEFVTKKMYGNVILIFKNEIQDRTIFTLFDSSRKHRRLPVIYNDAKYLYEKIKDKEVVSSMNNHPLTILTWYVESQIIGGVTLNDVKEILIPQKAAKKQEKLVKEILELLPHIKVTPV